MARFLSLCALLGNGPHDDEYRPSTSYGFILYISQTHAAINLLCQPPTCCFPVTLTPQAQRLLQTKLDRTKLYCVSAATCRQVWRVGSLFVPSGAHTHAALPFSSVTISPSIASHWHCLSREASNSFLSLHLFRNLWKHFPLTCPQHSPSVFNLGAKNQPQKELMSIRGSWRGNSIWSTEQKKPSVQKWNWNKKHCYQPRKSLKVPRSSLRESIQKRIASFLTFKKNFLKYQHSWLRVKSNFSFNLSIAAPEGKQPWSRSQGGPCESNAGIIEVDICEGSNLFFYSKLPLGIPAWCCFPEWRGPCSYWPPAHTKLHFSSLSSSSFPL